MNWLRRWLERKEDPPWYDEYARPMLLALLLFFMGLAVVLILSFLASSCEGATPTPTRTRTPTRTPISTITRTPTRSPTPTPTPTWPLVCSTPVFKGNDLIEVRVEYAHQGAPGVPYEVKLGPIHFEDDGNAVIRAQAHPVECDWRFFVIFRDGFEGGTTAAWE